MVRVDAYAREYERQLGFTQQVTEYFTRVASAVVSVFKRIFCIEDTISIQDLQWTAAKCRRLEQENHGLKQSIGDLQREMRSSTQDRKWHGENRHRLEQENRQLRQSVYDLQYRVRRMQRCDSAPSTLQKFVVEASLFFCLCPLYIISLPVMLIRDSLYEGLQKN